MTLEEADLDFVQRTKRIMNIKEIVYVVTKFSRVDEWCEYESALVGVYDSRQDAYECMQRVWEDILGYANDGDIIHEGQDECYVHANEYCSDYYEYSIRVEKHFV